MTTLLHIKASPRSERSHTYRAAGQFLQKLNQNLKGDLQVNELDIWKAELPAFMGPLISAKYTKLAGQELSSEQRLAWSQVEALVEQLARCDMLVISCPMWNLSIPYRLKHYIDLITQPGLTFNFDPQTGYRPLLPSKPVLILLASAGDFSTGTSWGRPDLATPYLQASLAFIGLTNTQVLPMAPTAGLPSAVEAAQTQVQAKLLALASEYAGAMK